MTATATAFSAGSALDAAGTSDHNNHAALGLDRVACLKVVLHRWAALQSQALLEPALACGINGREPRNPRLSISAKTRPFWLDFLPRASRGDGLDRLCKKRSMLARNRPKIIDFYTPWSPTVTQEVTLKAGGRCRWDDGRA